MFSENVQKRPILPTLHGNILESNATLPIKLQYCSVLMSCVEFTLEDESRLGLAQPTPKSDQFQMTFPEASPDIITHYEELGFSFCTSHIAGSNELRNSN